MLKLKPCKILVVLLPILAGLCIAGIFLSGLPVLIQVTLALILLAYSIIETLKILQQWPYSLVSFSMPSLGQNPWQIELKNGKRLEAKLLSSTRVTPRIIILHFRVLHSKMRVYQIVLPSTVGSEPFHDLLVHLKTT